MKKTTVYQVDAFTQSIFGGNPAGVVPQADELSTQDMQNIAREMNCSETAFVITPKTQDVDFEVRFFTPNNEVDLCGHATIGTFFTMASKELLPLEEGRNIITQRTLAGDLQVEIIKSMGNIERVIMEQNIPEFLNIIEDKAELAEILNVKKEDLEFNDLPMQIVSTGLPDLMVPISDYNTLNKIEPSMARLAKYQNDNKFISVHAFTIHENKLYVRDFAPSCGIDEEAATGTANGALASYLVKHKQLGEMEDNANILITAYQGQGMGRPSEIVVEITKTAGEISKVKVGGKAVIVLEGGMYYGTTINAE